MVHFFIPFHNLEPEKPYYSSAVPISSFGTCEADESHGQHYGNEILVIKIQGNLNSAVRLSDRLE